MGKKVLNKGPQYVYVNNSRDEQIETTDENYIFAWEEARVFFNEARHFAGSYATDPKEIIRMANDEIKTENKYTSIGLQTQNKGEY